MAMDLGTLDDDTVTFLTERHLSTLTTHRSDGSAHVAPVGFTYEVETRTARVITWATAQRVANVGSGARVALCQVDGGRWLTLEGEAIVTDDPDRVAVAVEHYAQRYRQPGARDDRVAIEVTVDRIMGRA